MPRETVRIVVDTNEFAIALTGPVQAPSLRLMRTVRDVANSGRAPCCLK